MSRKAMRFFFYGTLIAGSGNPAARAAHARLRDRGPATARGTLHAIADPEGWYPALLPGEGTVQGRLYEAEASFGDEDLARIDRYEGAEYVRRDILVMSGEGEEATAQAYIFRHTLPAGARPISDGDFQAWLAHEDLKPFGCQSDGHDGAAA